MATSSSNLQYGYPVPGPQSPSGEKIMEHLFFLTESQWERAREEKSYDLIIVGSGFCGLAVAQRALHNDPTCKILVVERGTLFLPEHVQNLPQAFVNTIGGLSETFPWTLAADLALGGTGTIRWVHGIVPFFGGRSTFWSTWCPRPTNKELHGWPEATKQSVNNYLKSAEDLLHVQTADEVDSTKSDFLVNVIKSFRPVYGKLQNVIQNRLEKYGMIKGVYRCDPAPLASDAKDINGIDFEKYSVPGELMTLARNNDSLDIATGCVVEKIFQQNGSATALQTSRGVLPIGNAKLVLAMGTLPATTLVRNSFPLAQNIGNRFSAHFITSIVARVPRRHLEENGGFGDLELGACYVAGIGKDYSQQYHIQLTALSDKHPEEHAGKALRYMPDLVATASQAQLQTSQHHVVFVCAVLGELDATNPENSFLRNADDPNLTTNSILHIRENQNDAETWDAMDRATFAVLEEAISPKGAEHVEYWHGAPGDGAWSKERPSENSRRVDAVVHESSTMHLGDEDTAPVGLDYKLKGTENVYVTGGALWPMGGSWNPTMVMVALAQHLADQLVNKKSEDDTP